MTEPLDARMPLGLHLVVGNAATAPRSPPFSRSRVGALVVELTASSGRVGVDAETRDRIALNTGPGDAWLTPLERRTVRISDDPLAELACRWVLKEAVGKALGIGLALPFDRVGFGRCGAAIAMDAAIAGTWTFDLRRAGDLIIGVAHQAATPLTPAGKKPPTPLLDRYRTLRI